MQQYITERKAARAKNATINRKLAALRRGYSLNRRMVTVRPTIEMLEEHNARQGFVSPADFERVRAVLAAEYRPLLTVSFITGWRTTSELLPMRWAQVDFAARVLRLEPRMTKNGRGREFPFTADLEAALREQRAYTDATQRKIGAIIPHVFHRNGKPIRYWRRRWLTALLTVGLAQREAGEDGQPKKGGKIIPHALVHDFRRGAIRALSRVGVSEVVGMQLCGHETAEVYRRYRIVTGEDLRDAVAKLDAAASVAIKVSSKVAPIDEGRAAVSG